MSEEKIFEEKMKKLEKIYGIAKFLPEDISPNDIEKVEKQLRELQEAINDYFRRPFNIKDYIGRLETERPSDPFTEKEMSVFREALRKR